MRVVEIHELARRLSWVFSRGIPVRVPIHGQYWVSTRKTWLHEGLPPDVSTEGYSGIELVCIAGDLTLQFPAHLVDLLSLLCVPP